MNDTYTLGAKKDIEDKRDFPIAKLQAPVALPASVDYESRQSATKNQAGRGACVAFATTAVKEYQEGKQRRFRTSFDFSEEWLYDQIRLPGGGAYIRDGAKILHDKGICKEEYMPYNPTLSDATVPPFTPSKAAARNAKYYMASAYARLANLDEMKQSLVQNGPFIFGVTWFSEWFNPAEKDSKGYPIIRKYQGGPVGGHALAIVGYDDTKQMAKFKNSWTKDWGKGGYAWFTYDVLREHVLDAWTTVDIANISREGLDELIQRKEELTPQE